MDNKNLNDQKEIYYAGGCFWGVEEYFSRIHGVVETTVGYANGNTENPTYEAVCYENTNHAEAVRVLYHPSVISLKTLTEQFFKVIDPTSIDRQGNDRGKQYRSGIYYTDEQDVPVLRQVWEEVQSKYSRTIETELLPLKAFYAAEDYHQDYLKKNPGGYCHINFSVQEPYPKPSDEELRKKLTPEQYHVTQENGTERPFSGVYWNHKEAGIYVDVATGQPLFLSSEQFDSGCGWPSFVKPIDSAAVEELTDQSHGMRRTEVRSSSGNSHLGHVFDDGPRDRGGLRYCINSAALRFVSYDQMEEEGYGKYKSRLKD